MIGPELRAFPELPLNPTVSRLAFLLLIPVLAACQASRNEELLSPASRMPNLQGILTHQGDPAAFPSAGTCRVVVVTTANCGISQRLANDWMSDLKAVIDSSGLDVIPAWIVFKNGGTDSSGVLGRSELPIWVADSDHRSLERLFGLIGDPHTLLVNARDSIVRVLPGHGNRLPTATELAAACRRR